VTFIRWGSVTGIGVQGVVDCGAVEVVDPAPGRHLLAVPGEVVAHDAFTVAIV
jgi:hypothetical protein